MRVDEARLKQVRRTDIMARIIESMKQEKARLERLERGEGEGSVSSGSE